MGWNVGLIHCVTGSFAREEMFSCCVLRGLRKKAVIGANWILLVGLRYSIWGNLRFRLRKKYFCAFFWAALLKVCFLRGFSTGDKSKVWKPKREKKPSKRTFTCRKHILQLVLSDCFQSFFPHYEWHDFAPIIPPVCPETKEVTSFLPLISEPEARNTKEEDLLDYAHRDHDEISISMAYFGSKRRL